MYTLSSDVLSMTDEPAALLQNRRLVFANAAARAILGEACLGKGIRELFGDEIAEVQAPNFVAAAPVSGRSRLLRFSREGSMQIVFFSRPETDVALFNDAYLQALRSGLMNMNLAAGAGRHAAEELGDPALLQCFSTLNKEYYKLNRLLANISAARAILADELPVALSTVDLGALIADLVDSVSLLRPDVEFQFSVERRVLLWADPQLLELLLLNLLSNSLIHAAGLRRIRIELSPMSDRVYLTVRDDGAGIPPEKMNSLFHRYRAAYSLHEMSMGAGLGMTVIRGIAEAHGGVLMLESREGMGTMARLSFSRTLNGSAHLREDTAPFASSMERLLTGLAPCLPDECFGGKYLE